MLYDCYCYAAIALFAYRCIRLRAIGLVGFVPTIPFVRALRCFCYRTPRYSVEDVFDRLLVYCLIRACHSVGAVNKLWMSACFPRWTTVAQPMPPWRQRQLIEEYIANERIEDGGGKRLKLK